MRRLVTQLQASGAIFTSMFLILGRLQATRQPEAWIRRAYDLWQQENCPVDRHEAHWQQAGREIEAEVAGKHNSAHAVGQ